MSEALSGWAGTSPDVIVHRLLISDAEVPYTVDRAARRGRLLVAGRGHKGWLLEMLCHISRSAPSRRRLCPVLLVPPGWSGAGLPRTTAAGTSRS